MTEENKHANIREEIERGEKAFQAATNLIDDGLFEDAISRLYYALFHSIRALLLSQGLEPRTHEGMAALFNANFVKKGLFRPHDLHLLSRMLKFRQEADYAPSYTFTKQDCKELVKEVGSLRRKIRSHLSAGKYL